MAELMKECLNLTKSKESRLLVGWFREIHHHTNMRTHILTLQVNPLSLILRHPCTSLLSLTWMEVSKEDSKIRTILIEYLVCLHIRMIYRYFLVFLERNAIKTCCKPEYSLDDIIQFEIWTYHLRINIILLQLKLVGIVRSIPRLKHKVSTHSLTCHIAKFLLFFQGSRFVCLHKLIKEVIHILYICRHTMLEHVVSISIISKKLCKFTTEIDKSLTNLNVVLLIIMGADCVVSHEHLLAKLTFLRILHER